MHSSSLCTASGIALMLLGASGANAAGVGAVNFSKDAGTILQRVHSVYQAEETLYRRGYYDVRLERASLPYSFNACKRGIRYHIHVDYYGDLVQVDEVGSCGRGYNGSAYYGRRPYYERYRYYRRGDY
jgi:hypothetical protein